MARRRRIPLKDLLLLRMNPVVRYLIVTDAIYFTASGLLGPIFAIFVTDFVQGGSPAVAGAAAAIFLLTKSIGQIPIGAFIDKVCGDVDDFWLMVGGMITINLLPLAYLFIQTPLELYIVQFFLGLATAFTFPSFMALFSRYIEKAQGGTVWSIYYTLVDLTSAGAAAIGGIMATTIGFEGVIIAATVIGILVVMFYAPVWYALKETPCPN